MPEFRIPAAELQLGDEVEMWEGTELFNPLYRSPNAKGIFWTVSELFDRGMQSYEDPQGHGWQRHPTTGAIISRTVTQAELEIDDTAWRALCTHLGLEPKAKKITLTQRVGFINHHVVRVRRGDPTPEAKALRHMIDGS